MKKILFTVAVASMFVACKDKKDSALETKMTMVPLTDSFRVYEDNSASDTAKYVESRAAEKDETAPVRTHRSSNPGSVNNGSSNSGTVSSNQGTNNTATAPAPAEKKGWSKAAKGAAIGAGAGAVTGAVIGKNAKGAVIGGVVGAAGGYIIGRAKDKKDGRVQ